MLHYSIRTDAVKQIFQTLTAVLQIRLVFFDRNHQKLEEFSVRGDSDYCRLRRKNAAFERRCRACDREHLDRAREEQQPLVYRCHENLIEGIVPLFDEWGKYVGAIAFGQIRAKGQRPGSGGGASWQKRYTALPCYDPEALRNIASMLRVVSAYILQNRLILLQGAPWVEALKDYIREHIAERLTVAQLARAVQYSSSFISHHFRKEFKLSPRQYIQQERMALARHALEDGETVKGTALRLGFCDEFHFSKTFKAWHGVSPRDHARQATKTATHATRKAGCPKTC